MKYSEKEGNKIIVPWDFSPVAGYALEHAERIARTTDKTIELLHIVKNESEIPAKEKELDSIAAMAFERYGLRPEIKVLEGPIFTAISNYASDTKANMVIMGTHGIKGIQKITGSYAFKVLLGSKVPFVVVQDPPPN